MSTAIEASLLGLRMDKRYHNWTKKKQAMYTLTYEIQTQTTVIYHYSEQSLEGSFFSAIWSNISKTSASVSSGFQTREN